MSLISHCIIILEITEDEASLPSSLTFKASKYTEITASTKKGEVSKGEQVLVSGSPSSIRGQRGTRSFAIETYSTPLPIFNNSSSTSPMSTKNTTKQPPLHNNSKSSSLTTTTTPLTPETQQQQKATTDNKSGSGTDKNHKTLNPQVVNKPTKTPGDDRGGKLLPRKQQHGSPSPAGKQQLQQQQQQHGVLAPKTVIRPPPGFGGGGAMTEAPSKKHDNAETGVANLSAPAAEETTTETSTDGDGVGGTLETKNFISGNPFVELTKGILHLHKDNEVSSLHSKDHPPAPRSEMLCMLAVPSTIECRDLIQYIAPFASDLESIKIIRDTLPNQYMTLLKFKSQKGADEFYKENNGVPFNSFEDDVCKLAYVSRVEVLRSNELAGAPLTGHTELPTCPVCLERMDESVDGILTVLCNHSFHTACLAKWSDSSCPVCRYVQTPEMVAHNTCIECGSSESLWICLICGHVGCGRYVQGHAYKHFCETEHTYAIQPDNNRVWDYVGDTFVHRLLQNKGDGKLVEVSGGGGRRGGGAARERERERERRRRALNRRRRRGDGGGRRQRTRSLGTTGITGQLPPESAGDGSGGGRLDRFNFSDDEADYRLLGGGEDDDEDDDSSSDDKFHYYEEEEKIDSMQLEFTHLLTSQLDAQRKYFEQKLGTFEQEMKKTTEGLNEKIMGLEKDKAEKQGRIGALTAENEKLVKNAQKLTKKLESLSCDLSNETTSNACLRADRDKWESILKQNDAKLKAQETEIQELKDQVRDLMLYLDFGNKIQESELKDEIQEGSVSLPPSEGAGAAGGGKSRVGGKGKRKH